jgi:hypothetical protein
MTKLLDIFDVVPGWLYALALAGLTVYCLLLDADVSRAISGEAVARAALATVKQDAATAATASTQAAREKETGLVNNQTESTDELHAALAATAGRAADLDRRLRDIAHAHPVASGACVPASAQASGAGDGPPTAGLSDVARSDLVRLAQSANDTADTLKACRVLLRQAWQATN